MVTANSLLQNRYRVVRLLGQGGMGAVYEAIDQRVNCVVALKQTLATRDGEARHAFEREAALLANLRHRALPKVMDYFSETEGDFLVMEFIPGHDLAELLDLRGGPFPQAQALRWAYDLLRVLEYLHGLEPPILHRDIKPSNLKLTKQEEIFLLDFGLAKGSVGQMPTFVTSRSVRGYTPVYAPLEQILGHGTDRRSDIYALGATLYHLLAGIPPVDAPTRYHAGEEEQPDPLPPIESVNPQASPRVTAVIHKSMAVARKNRYGTAGEMLEALRDATADNQHRIAEEEYRQDEARQQERVEQHQIAEEPEAKGDEVIETRPAEMDVVRAPKQEAAQTEPAERVDPLDTIPAPPPEPFSFKWNLASEKVEPKARMSKRAKTVLLGTAAVVLILLSSYVVWLALGRRSQNTATQAGPAAVVPSEQAAVVQSGTPQASPIQSPSPTPIVSKQISPPSDFLSFAKAVVGEFFSAEVVQVREIDLNQDGVSELIAQIDSCGNRGCPTRIFRRSGTNFQEITGDLEFYMFPQLTRARVEGGPATSRGYLDIKYDRQSFKFDGRKYVCSNGC